MHHQVATALSLRACVFVHERIQQRADDGANTPLVALPLPSQDLQTTRVVYQPAEARIHFGLSFGATAW
jgi:hypothetical protein